MLDLGIGPASSPLYASSCYRANVHYGEDALLCLRLRWTAACRLLLHFSWTVALTFRRLLGFSDAEGQ